MEGVQVTATAQSVLEGVPLPAEKDALLAYAARQDAPDEVREALASIPDRSYESLDEVGEAIAPAQPALLPAESPRPSAKSGAPPGGDGYVA